MTSIRNTARTGRTARWAASAGLALFGCLCGICGPARADVAIYQAAVPLKGVTDADRAAGFGEALKVAAVRASGRRGAASDPRIAAAAADSASYVQQYATTSDRLLKVGFDGRAMEQLLQQAGLPLWPAERPTTTVLLFVPSIAGGGRAVLGSEHPAERAEIERAAQVRGVPLSWPSETIDPVAARSRAEGVGPAAAVLAGGPQSGWTFGHAGQTATGQGGATAGLDLAADTLASRYATGATRGRNVVELRIGGLRNVADYAALTRYLEGLSLVRSVDVQQFAGDTASFQLGVRGDLELLRRIFALDGRLAPVTRGEGADPSAAEFAWQPR